MNQAQRLMMQHMGISGAPDLSGLQMPTLRTQEDLAQLREVGINKGPNSYEYMAWTNALAMGLDETLPTLTGAIPRSVESQEYDLATSVERSRQYYTEYPAGYEQLTINGRSLVEMPADEVEAYVAQRIVDTPNGSPERNALVGLLAGLQSAGKTSIQGMSFDSEPEEVLEIRAATYEGETDAFAAYHQQQQANNLQQLQMRSVNNDAGLFDGITSPDGLSYDSYQDVALQNARAESAAAREEELNG